MAFGEIYKTTWWGSGIPNPINWGSVYADLSETFNEYSMQFDGVTPGEAITAPASTYNMNTQNGFGFYAWVKISPTILTFGNFAQRCIIDFSQDIYNTANGKGYSIFVRKTASTFTLNWFFKRTGETRANCSCIINLQPYDLNKPILIVAGIEPDGLDPQVNSRQVFRAYQQGLNPNNYYEDNKLVANTCNPLCTPYPTGQNFVIGNTNDAGTTSSEFVGEIDEVATWKGAFFGWENASANYFDGINNEYRLDLNSSSSGSRVSGLFLNSWFRMGDGATFNGSTWSIPNASDTSSSPGAVSDTSMTLANRVNQIIN